MGAAPRQNVDDAHQSGQFSQHVKGKRDLFAFRSPGELCLFILDCGSEHFDHSDQANILLYLSLCRIYKRVACCLGFVEK